MAHWYTKDGKRFSPVKNDGTPYKVVTSKLAASFGAVRGVTDILKYVGDKGWMSRYFSSLGLEAAKFTHSLDKSDEEWMADALEEFTLRSESAANEGTRIHGLIDDLLTGKKTPMDEREALLFKDIMFTLKEYGVDDLSKAELERTFYYEDGKGLAYGGTRDLFYPPNMLFLDWKTIVKARDPRIDELAQIAAYQGREMLGSLAADVYVSQETMRVVRVEPWSKEQLEFGWDYFTTAYKIMQMNDRFNEDVRR